MNVLTRTKCLHLTDPSARFSYFAHSAKVFGVKAINIFFMVRLWLKCGNQSETDQEASVTLTVDVFSTALQTAVNELEAA